MGVRCEGVGDGFEEGEGTETNDSTVSMISVRSSWIVRYYGTRWGLTCAVVSGWSKACDG